jgi:hypothetical protein
MPRFVDLSIFLENEVLSDPPMLAPKIESQKHQDTLPEFMQMLPGTQPDDFPDQEAAAAEWVRLTTHSGTHLDAPYHFRQPARFRPARDQRIVQAPVPMA